MATVRCQVCTKAFEVHNQSRWTAKWCSSRCAKVGRDLVPQKTYDDLWREALAGRQYQNAKVGPALGRHVELMPDDAREIT